MKLIRLALSIVLYFFLISTQAQNATSKTWAAYERVSLNFEYFDLATNSNQDVYLAGGGAASGFNFSIKKYDSSGTIVFTKSYVSRNQAEGKIDLDNNGDVFVISSFASIFELGTDTFTTPRTNDKDLFVGKFNGQTGDDIWVKTYNRDDYLYAQMLSNGNYLISLEAYPGDFIFGGDTITSINTRSEVFLVLSSVDGTVLNHYTLPVLQNNPTSQNYVEGTTLTHYDVLTPLFSAIKYVRRNVIDLTSGAVVRRDSLVFEARYSGPRNYLSENGQGGSAYNPVTKELYLAVGAGADYMYFGIDTLNQGEYGVVRLDSLMNLMQFIRTEIPMTKMLLENGRLVMSGLHTPYNTSTNVWFGNDTLAYPNSQKSHLIVSSDLDFVNREYTFMATDSWQTGLELLNMELDDVGNVYALGWHSNDILFSPFTSASLNRSWKHNCAFGKWNVGNVTSLVELSSSSKALAFEVYPNPFENSVNVNFQGDFDYQVFTISGQVVSSGNSNNLLELNLGDLPKGVYLVRVVKDRKVGTRRIVKF